MSDFGSRFRERRRELKLNQDERGAVFGVTRRTIWAYEHDTLHPDFKGLLFIAEYFGVSLDYLVGWSDERDVRR